MSLTHYLVLPLIGFFLLATFAPVQAQDECEARIALAESLFEQGRLFQLADTLAYCLSREQLRDMRRSSKRQMLSLLAETNQYLNRFEAAQQNLIDLRDADPFYRLNTQIPELEYLEESVITYPVTAFTLYGGVHLVSDPVIIKVFELAGVEILEEGYERQADDPFGWHAGLQVGFSLGTSNFDLSTGLAISRISYRYNGLYANAEAPDGQRLNAEVSFRERHWWGHIPIFLSLNLIPKDRIVRARFIPYVYAGGQVDLLRRKSAAIVEANTRFEDGQEVGFFDDFSLEDQRLGLNGSLLAGAGARWHFERLYLQADIRFSHTLQSLVDGENRVNPELVESLNYIDDDFRLNNLLFTVGAGAYLFNTKARD